MKTEIINPLWHIQDVMNFTGWCRKTIDNMLDDGRMTQPDFRKQGIWK